MTDDLKNDTNQMNDVKDQIFSEIRYYRNHRKASHDLNIYPTWYVLQQANNYLYSKEFAEDNSDPSYLPSLEKSLQGLQSKYDNDLRSSHKVTKHAANNALKKIEKITGASNTRDATKVQNYINQLNYNMAEKAPILTKKDFNSIKNLWDANNYNYNNGYKDPDTYESQNNSWKMVSGVLKWRNYVNQLHNYALNYSKKHPGYIKDTISGKTYYFPDSLNSAAVDGLINEIKRLNSNKRFYDNQTSNEYHKMANNLYNGNLNSVKHDMSDNFLDNLNNHPNDNIPAEESAANAYTNYQYRIQKDRNWEQYYQDNMNRMNDYARMMAKAYHKNAKDIVEHGGCKYKAIKNKTTFWGLGQIFHIPWQSIQAANPKVNPYRIMPGEKLNIPTRASSRKLSKIDREIARYAKGGKYYNQSLKLRNQWKTKADKLNGQLPSQKQKIMGQAYLNATIDNIKTDDRHGKFAFVAPRYPRTEDSYVFMMVTDESPTFSNEASTTPVEWGRNITTTTQEQPTTVEITGTLFNNNLPQSSNNGQPSQEPNDGHGFDPVIKDANQLAKWSDWGSEMFYCGTNLYPHCIITSFNPDYNTGQDGSLTSCSFSMTIQLADYFQSNTSQKSGGKHGKSTHHGNIERHHGKNRTKKHRIKYVRAKAGTTFSGIAIKKHVPVSKIERLNRGTSPTDIQIGQKIKV